MFEIAYPPPSPVRSALDAIGRTPLVRLRRVVPSGSAAVYLKLEFFNPTGSYKDRMAKSLIEGAEESGKLVPGMTIVEASGGSTGSSLAFVCAVKGHALRIISSNAFAREKLDTIRSFGAEVELIESESGRITADLIPRMVERAWRLGAQDGFYYIDQFNNRDSLPGYATIGEELREQLPGGIDAFCGGAGIAGMVMGVASSLKARSPATRIIVLEPAESPTITTGAGGAHKVEGLGVGFRPPLLDAGLHDGVRTVAEAQAMAMCRSLAREEGILAGTSTGLNVVAAIELARELGPARTVVTVACDTGLKYLSGPLFRAS